ncbi:MAG: hypothetical protein HOM68_21605, partial [Gemmatimonadetes bacterium]|nr:hypothetical protein [Gemmatimonadota bacterium]
RHVEQEMRAYLECGIVQYGFLRVRCEDCGESRVSQSLGIQRWPVSSQTVS